MGAIFRDEHGYGYVFDAPRSGDGKRRQVRKRGFKTKKEAKDALKSAEGLAEQGIVPAKGNLKTAAFLLRWLETVEQKVRPKTFESYAEMVRLHLAPGLGTIELGKLTAERIDRHLREQLVSGRMSGGALSPRSVQYQHRVLYMAMEQALRWQMIPRNPVALVDPPRVPRVEAPVLDAGQVRMLLEHLVGDWLYFPVFLALATGMRRGELCALKWSDVDMDRGVVCVRRSVSYVGKVLSESEPKGGRSGLVALPAGLVELLRLEKIAREPGDGYVVCEPGGGRVPPDALTRRFGKMARELGLSVTFHSLRHTHATMLLSAGVHDRVIMDQLRHSTLAMMQRYTHVLPPMQTAAAEQIDRIMKGD